MKSTSDPNQVGHVSTPSADRSPRDADMQDLGKLAALWFAGWQDAHLDILPPSVAADRTLDSFHVRLAQQLSSVRTIGPIGAPTGFSLIKGDELNQFYVEGAARGSGIAAILMADVEEKLRGGGFETAWLACAIGNSRAARFYEKSGWRRAGVATINLALRTGDFELAVWRYEKQL
jgi:GNAT superfamily N-acetyltransferase